MQINSNKKRKGRRRKCREGGSDKGEQKGREGGGRKIKEKKGRRKPIEVKEKREAYSVQKADYSHLFK